MRCVCLVFVAVLAMPQLAIAQYSPSLPSIGLPLPPIGLPPARWERPQSPWWENQPPPPWERQHVARPVDPPQHRPSRPYFPQPFYVWQPYVIEVPQPPQVIVVQQPVETRIVEVEVPAREAPPIVPYVPTGDRTLYVIPGCYVGNVPPKDVKLPAGCDAGKVTTFTP